MCEPERHRLCYVLVLATLAISSTLVSKVNAGSGTNLPDGISKKQCYRDDLMNRCGENERCMEDPSTPGTYVCLCLRNFIIHSTNGTCVREPTTTVPPDPETTTEKLNGTSGSSGSSVAVGLLVPTFIILFGVLGFCAARRYGFLPCRRNLYGNVLVTRDDDDDDPPIA